MILREIDGNIKATLIIIDLTNNERSLKKKLNKPSREENSGAAFLIQVKHFSLNKAATQDSIAVQEMKEYNV